MTNREHAQQAIGLSYVKAVAVKAGVTCSCPDINYGVDVTLEETVVDLDGRRISTGHKIDCFLKSTVNWEPTEQGVTYDLETENYNDLVSRQRSSSVLLILILLCLPKDESKWVELSEEQLLIRARCYYWAVSAPHAQPFTPKAIRRLFAALRRREGV